MRKTLLLVFCLTQIFLLGQTIIPSQVVKERKSITAFKSFDLFGQGNAARKGLPTEFQSYSVLKINREVQQQILKSTNQEIKLSLPFAGRSNVEVELVEVKFDNLIVRTSESNKAVKVKMGKHFRGVVKGLSHSLVALSIFENDVMGFISSEREEGNLVIAKMQDNSGDYIVYQDSDVNKKLGFSCDTKSGSLTYDAHQLHGNEGNGRALTDCTGLYYEVDDDIYTEKGGTTQTVNYVTGLHNQVAALYANESINVNIAEIFVWTTTSPYTGTTSSDMLNQFTAYRNGFNGNLAMLLSYGASGGIAYVNTLCNSISDYRMGFSSIYNNYATVPSYSWSVEVITHEFGHLFGSQHTHDCVWNGNNTAIDGCFTPSGCADPGLPSGGGTIMSYCHLTNAGINFSNGFGSQPGNVIRNAVTNATCLSSCSGSNPTCTDGIQNGLETGVDCGGPNCPPCSGGCSSNSGTFTLVLDDYPSETSWNITNQAGVMLYSGTSYTSPGATITIPLCLPNGCYTFNIYDAFGDGICCLYGQGSYNVQINGTTHASGGEFGASQSVQFCLANNTPSCTDGIQNGNETGVDCGGSCPACPSCNDGIQNQGETGIDCGGPCTACPTCGDGIQNGNETGVDCGGSCPACATCTDGIQNGNETGVDCGGSCTACATCSDGIQNQGETGIDCGGPCSACATCGDGIQNGNETGVDCGGSCPACATCGDGIQNGNETGVDCGGSCPACATCTDGIQNGNETGVDCGGSCPDCATCTDGIQNGNETGVDCGGSCPACATCGDGIQNGNETGVDCGGSCPACATCTDGIQNGNETGVDCGGSCSACASCTDGIQNGNETGVDCGGSCPACATCGDGIQNGNETGVDCGGSCPACATCGDGIQNGNETGVDCGGSCPACATCTDGIQNGNETGVDCGGSCPACASCTDGIQNGNETGVDCGGSCTACATCSDGIQNQGETGIDCGGPCTACATCSDGIQNQGETGIDCGGPCTACATCSDGIQNQGETGIDCGGPCTACATCSDGIQNQGETGIDCGGPCTACATCSDGIQNQGETGIDCGGPCTACATCSDGIQNQGETGIDCGGPCTACATCSDGIQNQGETGIDCGGPCTACATCSDGIQNQGETGIDCGGPCTACATCSDGIQNQGETGIDCGGPCTACATCSDGIKNGNETGVDCGGSCPACPVQLGAYYFETGWNSWVDGGVDAARYTGPRSAEGVWSIELRDNTGATGAMTSPKYSAATYASLKIEFRFYMFSFESGEDFWLQYSSNNGSSWTTIKTYAAGSTYSNGVFYTKSVVLNAGTYSLTNNAKFRFVSDASADDDVVYIDAVVVKAYTTPQPLTLINPDAAKSSKEVEVKVYPNPVLDYLTIELNQALTEDVDIRVMDLTGRLLGVSTVAASETSQVVNVSDYANGLYLISMIRNGKIIHTEKISILH